MNIPDIYKLLFWFLCLGLTIYVIYNWTIRAYLNRRIIKANGEEAKARIIQYETIELYEEPDKQTFYRCYLEYFTKSGQKIIVKPEENKHYKYAPGTELTVYYLKDDPYRFYIKEILPFQTSFLPLGIIVLCYSLYYIALIVLRHT